MIDNYLIVSQVFIGLTSLFIVVSVTQFCLSTVTAIKENNTPMRILRTLDAVTSIWFTAEFLLRLVFCPDFKRFATNPMNWIDLLAVLPFYLSLYHVGSRTSWLVVMRTFRIFRIFSLSFSFQIGCGSLAASTDQTYFHADRHFKIPRSTDEKHHAVWGKKKFCFR